MKLSDRLQTVAKYITPGYRLADIGTDHGYIPIYLVSNGIVPSAIAMDINKGPLERAKEHIEEYGLQDKVETRLSNGLLMLDEDEVDSILIAGMGGALIVDILSAKLNVAKNAKELILSPHSEADLVRKYLNDSGFKIITEKMVFDSGKYYVIIKCNVSNESVENYTETEYLYGKRLIEQPDDVFLDYLNYKRNSYKKIVNGLSKNPNEEATMRRNEIENEILEIEEIIKLIERS